MFETILTVLIAMEFHHTIVRSMQGEGSVIQLKIVLLIGMLAIVREFLIMEIETLDPAKVGALALAVLALGITYWLMRERGDRRAQSEQRT